MSDLRFMLRNDSGSEGSYLLDGQTYFLMPGDKKILDREPTTVTANIILSRYLAGRESEVLNKLPKDAKGLLPAAEPVEDSKPKESKEEKTKD